MTSTLGGSMEDNIDWLYRRDIFYCEFCEATHDATNHIDDDPRGRVFELPGVIPGNPL